MNASVKPSGLFVTVLLKKAFVLSKKLGELRENDQHCDHQGLSTKQPSDHVVLRSGNLGAQFGLGCIDRCFQLGLRGGGIAHDQRDVLLVGEFDLRGSDFSDDGLGCRAAEAGRLDALDGGKSVEVHVHGARDTTGRAMNPVRRSWLAVAASISLILSGDPALAQATHGEMQSAQQDGNTFGKAAKEGAASIPDQQVTSEVVPGFQPAPANLSDLFGSDDGALNSAAGSAAGNDSWQTMMGADSNRAQINPADLDDIRQRGQEINDSASTDQVGLGSPTSTPGTCEEVTKSTTQVTYEATCDKGVTVSEVAKEPSYSCPSGWTLVGTNCTMTLTQPADVSYSCPGGGSLSGQTCTQSQPATVSGYTCPSGFSLSGTNCTQALTQAASVSGYSCPADYMLRGTTCVRTLQQSATPVYSCPAGYELSGTSCTSASTYAATPNYSCPADYTISGTACYKTQTQVASISYSCPNGYTQSGSNCNQTTSYSAAATYVCPTGYTLSGTTCSSSSNYGATASYSCDEGWTLSGTTCTQVQTVTAGTSYQCYGSSTLGIDDGTYSKQPGTYCIVSAVTLGSASKCPSAYGTMSLHHQSKIRSGANLQWCMFNPARVYTCPGGYNNPVSGICTINASQVATVSYSCPNGGTLSGSTCTITSSTSATVDYSCPNDGALSGSTCTTSSTISATPSYFCPSGWTLSGTSCSSTVSQPASVAYACPNGGSLSGSTCTVTNSQAADVSYNCPADWSLSGQTCTSTQTQTATPIYTCPVGYSLAGSMCSKTEVQPATAQYVCSTGFSLSGTTCSRSDPATPSYTCPTGYVRTETTCTQNLSQPATMTLVCPEGATVQDGTCFGETAGESDCQDLEQNTQCTWLRDTCLDESQNGPCKVTERTFQCPVPGEPAKENKEYVCSGDLYCINGSCQTIEREASNDFKDALVAMGAIDQTEKEFDPDKLGLFKGTRETCHKPVFGLVNCCAGKVSGLLSGGAAYAASLANAPVLLTAVATQFLTVFLCSKEEKMLDVKDRLGLCHFVESYCAASFLGVCTTKKKAYCCFESKLTRILQEQGRPQINKPWAKPKEEKCEGFTVDEFSRLDMSKMDFSGIYSEFLEAAKLPNEAQMATDIQAKIQQYYQQNASGGT